MPCVVSLSSIRSAESAASAAWVDCLAGLDCCRMETGSGGCRGGRLWLGRVSS